MSDRLAELRSIQSSDESDPGPHVDERAVVDAAPVVEADEDETNDLSPEALVAESVRQTNAELGLEDEDEGEPDAVDASAADEPDDIAALKEKARLWEEHQATLETQRVDADRQAIIAEARQNEQTLATTKQRYKDFYKKEEIRLLDEVDADAENAPNPRAYRAVHRQAAIDACRRAEELKLAELDQDHKIAYDALNARYEAIDQQLKMAQQKPAYADFLMTHPDLNLPADDAEIRAEILRAGNNLTGEDALHAMTRRAREITWMVDRLRAGNQTLVQQAAEVKAKEVKHSQPHPASATNTPRRAKPVEYAPEGGSKRKQQLSAILAMR